MILDKKMLEKYDDCMSTSKVYDCLPIIYPILGLNGEAGEAAEKVKKCLRDNNGKFDEETKNAIKKELADVLWYIWAAADDMNTSLDEIMSIGIKKVKERQETNTVHGNGDDREIKAEAWESDFPEYDRILKEEKNYIVFYECPKEKEQFIIDNLNFFINSRNAAIKGYNLNISEEKINRLKEQREEYIGENIYS